MSIEKGCQGRLHHPYIYRIQQMHHKSMRGRFCSLFQELGGIYDKFINCRPSINFLYKNLIIFYTDIGQYRLKMSNLQRKLAHSNSTCLQRCRWQYWRIFIRLAVVASEICDIPRNSLKIQTYGVQGHPRSSILVSIESPCTTSY